MSTIQNPKRFAFVCLCLAAFVCAILLSYVGAARAAYTHFTQPHPRSFRDVICDPPNTACSCTGSKIVKCCSPGTSCYCDDSTNPATPTCNYN
jgi:hypothetical protein